MESETIYSSEFIEITKAQDGYYIESFKKGLSMDQFNKVMGGLTEIRITNFINIKNAILSAPRPPAKFGERKERISVEITNDELRAYVTVNVQPVELEGEKKFILLKEVLKCLQEKGVVYGINVESLAANLCNGKQILAAEGVPPQNGQDSKIRMYEMKEVKPELKEDGKVDHYELNLIDKVEVGAWLGEREDPTPGINGKSVKGNEIPAMSGKNYPLFYDKNSVKEVSSNGMTRLYATVCGAVHYEGERIGVSNHLEITSNIDFKTGNIDFDGYLTVKGSIEDNFSIAANRDIEVLGEYGVGSVREIISHEGSVYIKGGIAGKNKAIVRSRKDVYTKFVSDATIICEGSVHIGYYCLNSNIVAKEVILDSSKGQIIGGNINAEIKVVSSIIGTPAEKRTNITIRGFNRATLKERLEKVLQEIEDLKVLTARAKQEIAIYSSAHTLTEEQVKVFEYIKDKYFNLKDKTKDLEGEKKVLTNYLRTHGEGEVAVLKRAYPGTVLEMRKMVKELTSEVVCTTFYIQDRDIKQV